MILPSYMFAMQELPLVHVKEAEDVAKFSGQIVAYTPVYFLCDRYTYKEIRRPLDSTLRYALVSQQAIHDHKHYWMPIPEREKREKGHELYPLITANVKFMNHILLTEKLQKDKLLMRKITPKEAARLLQILNERKAHFEGGNSLEKIKEALKQLISKS